jgi:hypothetical protein
MTLTLICPSALSKIWADSWYQGVVYGYRSGGASSARERYGRWFVIARNLVEQTRNMLALLRKHVALDNVPAAEAFPLREAEPVASGGSTTYAMRR